MAQRIKKDFMRRIVDRVPDEMLSKRDAATAFANVYRKSMRDSKQGSITKIAGNISAHKQGIFNTGARSAKEPLGNLGRMMDERSDIQRTAGSIVEEISAGKGAFGNLTEDQRSELINNVMTQAAEASPGYGEMGMEALNTGWEFVKGDDGDLVGQAVRGGAVAIGAGTAYRGVTGRGGPMHNERGNFDIAGIPFV